MSDGIHKEKEADGPADVAGMLMEVNHTLKFMAEAGCSGFDCREPSLRTLRRWGGNQAPELKETMEDIQADLIGCRRCGLCQTRTQIVFGDGSASAGLVFVGEGPGYEEDKQGVPFVGAAGQLLDKIITAMQLARDEVYICNIIKCRPPGNRNPAPAEIEACNPFLERQLKVVRPDFICALGSVAAQTILKTQTPISRLRGRFYEFMGARVLPTYHPAYLLRNPEKKRDVWQDMQMLMQEMGIG